MSHSSLVSWFSKPWQVKPSFISHTCLSWLLGSSFMQGSWETGWEEAGELCGYRVYGYKDQNEKGNLSCHMSPGPEVMPSIKLNWDAAQADSSLFMYLCFVWWSFRELSVCVCCLWWCWLRIPTVDCRLHFTFWFHTRGVRVSLRIIWVRYASFLCHHVMVMLVV